MQHYTVQDILALRPCQPTEDRPNDGYPEHRIRDLFGDRRSVTALEICDDERVPIEDRQWVLHRLLPEPLVHEAACRYAEHALEREQARGYEPDPRSWAAIEAKRQWLRDMISDGDLDAARDAAETAAESASWIADRAAARTAWAAALAAASAAARDTTRHAMRDVTSAAAWAAANAAWAAADIADATTEAAARDTERRWQLNTLREMIGEIED